MSAPSTQGLTRLRLLVRGAVQGVGFRPFVHLLATEMHLAGWVKNGPQGVCIEVEGTAVQTRRFLARLPGRKPPHCVIEGLEPLWLDPAGYRGFEIRPSDATGEKSAWVLPDIATCPACLAEVRDPGNRRHRYPFTNCTHCGPRFTIIEALPYDRANTSMRRFTQCAGCQAEYENPADRRFHAQPNACPDCGPQLALWDGQGKALARREEALRAAAAAIRDGKIVAVKGLGGFHLMVNAGDETAVRLLRQRKAREEKPLALMFPDLRQVAACCRVDPLERRLLESPEAPIVLLRRRSAAGARAPRLAHSVAPGHPCLGAMLPATPLHHLLLTDLGFPVVATSGNLSDEPICIGEREALERLGTIADFFLVHDRPIVRHADDSIVRVVAGRELVLRRARGFAPLPVPLPPGGWDADERGDRAGLSSVPPVVLGVGAHLKNAVALGVGGRVFVSQHIGDLENVETLATFRRVTEDMQTLQGARAEVVAADAHPDYLSTRFARGLGLPVCSVQHHHAHVLACMAENGLRPPVLGVAWDGTGYGLDGTVWGGEFFRVTEAALERVAHLRSFRLPGGERAVREPRRSALGLLFEMLGEAAFEELAAAPWQAFKPAELALLRQSLPRGLQSPLTTSAGRLFDAVASLIGLRHVSHYEGQAAMELEFAAAQSRTRACYPVNVSVSRSGDLSGDAQARPPEGGNLTHGRAVWVLDWEPMIRALQADLAAGVAVGTMAARVHHGLAQAIVAVARQTGEQRVVLSGGCFQNRRLVETSVRLLHGAGFRPYWHQRVPPNDGGVALGQVLAARRAPN
jgi:hydrogenase maturation protein HypF